MTKKAKTADRESMPRRALSESIEALVRFGEDADEEATAVTRALDEYGETVEASCDAADSLDRKTTKLRRQLARKGARARSSQPSPAVDG